MATSRRRHVGLSIIGLAALYWLLQLVAKWAELQPETRLLGKTIDALTSEPFLVWVTLILAVAAGVWEWGQRRQSARIGGFPFQIYSSASLDTLREQLEEGNAPHRYDVWGTARSTEIWSDLRSGMRSLVVGRSGVGKTRLCFDVIGDICSTIGEPVTIVVPDEDFDVPQPPLPKEFKRRHVILFAHDFDRFLSETDDGTDGPLASSSLDRLLECIEWFERHATISFRVIVTANTEGPLAVESLQEALKGFTGIMVPLMDRSAVRGFTELVARYFGITLTEGATEAIYRKTDLTCASIVTALSVLKGRTKNRATAIDEHDLEAFDVTYPRDWAQHVYPVEIVPLGERRVVFEALAILSHLRLMPTTSLVVEVAAGLLDEQLIGSSRRRIRRVLADDLGHNWLVIGRSRVFIRSALLDAVAMPADWKQRLESATARLLKRERRNEGTERLLIAIVRSLARVDRGAASRVLENALRRLPESAALHSTRAILMVRQGRLDDALQSANASVRLAPGSGNAAVVRSIVFAALGRRDENVSEAQRAAKLAPDASYPWFVLGMAMSRAGRYGDAVKALRTAVKRNGHVAKVWHTLGIALDKIGSVNRHRGVLISDWVDEARAVFLRATQLAPRDGRYWLAYGRFELAQGRFEVAKALLAKAVALDPSSDAALILANMLALSGERADAAAVLEAFSDHIDPADARGYSARAQSLLLQGNADAALEQAQHAVGLVPDNIVALETLAACQSACSDNPSMAATYQRIASERGWSQDFYHLARALLVLGRNGEAYIAAKKAAEAVSRNVGPYCVMARSFSDVGEPDALANDSLQFADLVLQSDSRNAGARMLKANARYVLGEYAAAEELWRDLDELRSRLRFPLFDRPLEKQDLVRLHPDSEDAWVKLASAAWSARDASLFFDLAEEEALASCAPSTTWDRALSEMLRLAPRRSARILRWLMKDGHESARRFHLLSVALRHSGDITEALPAASEAVRLEPRVADHWTNLARTYDLVGNQDEAIRCYEHILVLNPSHRKAKERLAMLRSRIIQAAEETPKHVG
jgi:tetratricopeptide (TPR) repeat protein